MKHIKLLGLIALLPFLARAQNLSEKIITEFPSSVTVRVYDINSVIPLNYDKQVKIATLFLEEEDVILNAIKSKRSSFEIDALKDHYKQTLYSFFAPEDREILYTQILTKPAKIKAAYLAEQLSRSYKIEKDLKSEIEDLYFRYHIILDKEALEISNRGENKKELPDILINKMQTDSLLRVIHIYEYLATKISFLDNIKPLSKVQKAYITRSFLNRSFAATASDLNEIFRSSLQGTMRDTIYYVGLYQESIARTAQLETSNYFKKHKEIPLDVRVELRPLVNKKFQHTIKLEYAFPAHTALYEKQVAPVIDTYDKEIDSVLTRRGVKLPEGQFAVALQYKRNLELTEGQIDSILLSAAKLQGLVNAFKTTRPDKSFDTRRYESDHLKRTLNKVQYEKFLNLKNLVLAKSKASENWDKLNNLGLLTGLNKKKTVDELMKYELKALVAKDRLYAEASQINKHLKQKAENEKPEILIKLETAQKDLKAAQAIKNSYAW